MRNWRFESKFLVLFLVMAGCIAISQASAFATNLVAKIVVDSDFVPNPALAGQAMSGKLSVKFYDAGDPNHIEAEPAGTEYDWDCTLFKYRAPTDLVRSTHGDQVRDPGFQCTASDIHKRAATFSGSITSAGEYVLNVYVRVKWDGHFQTPDPKVDINLSVVHLQVCSLKFGGDGYRTIETDPTEVAGKISPSQAYDPALWHWLDDKADGATSRLGDHRFPVCYKRNTQMFVSVRFLSDQPGGTFSVVGQGDDGAYFVAPLNRIGTTNKFEANNIAAMDGTGVGAHPKSLINQVHFYSPYKIHWTITQGHVDHVSDNAGITDNRVCVTLDFPAVVKEYPHLYESVLEIACRGGQNVAHPGNRATIDADFTPDAVVDAIFEEFKLKNPNIGVQKKKIDGYNKPDAEFMRYYLPLPILSYTPSIVGDEPGLDFLLAHDGARCGGWASLFEAALAVHRISVYPISCKPDKTKYTPGTDKRKMELFVNPWQYDHHIEIVGGGRIGVSTVAAGSDDVPVAGIPPLWIMPGSNGTLDSHLNAADGSADGYYANLPNATPFFKYVAFEGVRGEDPSSLAPHAPAQDYGSRRGDFAFQLKPALTKLVGGAHPLLGEGQGNPFPPAFFLDHAIVEYPISSDPDHKVRIYDPSYGKRFPLNGNPDASRADAEAQHEMASFAGIGLQVDADEHAISQYHVHPYPKPRNGNETLILYNKNTYQTPNSNKSLLPIIDAKDHGLVAN